VAYAKKKGQWKSKGVRTKPLKNVLITGGCGFIGSHLTDLLLEKGCNVTVIDSLEPQVHNGLPNYLDPRAKYYFDRLISKRLPYSFIFKDIDTVYYFASKVGPNQSMTDIADYVDCNINNLGHFLQQFLGFGKSVKRIILSASMGPYGEGSYECTQCFLQVYPRCKRKEFEYCCPQCGAPATNRALDENSEINNISYYGLSKNVQEDMLALFAKTHSVEFISLRYFSVYGPRQASNNPYAGPIPIWISAALDSKDIVVFEDGNQTRDFIHVKDISQINYRAGSYDVPSEIEIINCGTGTSTRIIDVARIIKQNLCSDSPITITKTIRVGDLRHSRADNSKLQSLLRYTDFINVQDGLRSLAEETRASLSLASP